MAAGMPWMAFRKTSGRLPDASNEAVLFQSQNAVLTACGIEPTPWPNPRTNHQLIGTDKSDRQVAGNPHDVLQPRHSVEPAFTSRRCTSLVTSRCKDF